ncbi:unnamed protein product, partial [Rangifer tarandus platyrhynchus]
AARELAPSGMVSISAASAPSTAGSSPEPSSEMSLGCPLHKVLFEKQPKGTSREKSLARPPKADPGLSASVVSSQNLPSTVHLVPMREEPCKHPEWPESRVPLPSGPSSGE